jgi:hypothetical protein
MAVLLEGSSHDVAWPDPAVTAAVASSAVRVLEAVVDDELSPSLFAAMCDIMIQVCSLFCT